MDKRYKVIPFYEKATNYRRLDELVGYVLWDNVGKCVVDEYGVPLPADRYDIKDRNFWYWVHSPMLLTKMAETCCKKSYDLNQNDLQYQKLVKDYGRLNWIEKLMLIICR